MSEVVIVEFFLGASLLLYCLLGGADFGAGILEAFLRPPRKEEQQTLLTKAIGPVWEANHIWLILAIVIVFVGFPRLYAQVSIHFHIPLMAMLVGIIMRGCAFTFRQYDAYQDRSQIFYGWIYRASSFITPFFIGVTAGGMVAGRIDPLGVDAYSQFIKPWFHPLSLAVGLFVCSLFGMLAALYMVGETKDVEMRAAFTRRARQATVAAVTAGMGVFVAGYWMGKPLLSQLLQDPIGLTCVIVATGLIYPIHLLSIRRPKVTRFLAALQVSCILVSWFDLQFPQLDLRDAAAPTVALRGLVWALVLGGVFILPAFYYLLKVFKLR